MSMYGVTYEPVKPGEGSGAKQSMKDECDVNKIVLRYQKTGLITHLAGGVPAFVDVSELGDYRSVIEQVRSVEAYFAGLPATVRAVFANDARSFMDYLEGNPDVSDLEEVGLEAIEGRLSAIEDRPVVVEPSLEAVPASSDGSPELPPEDGTVLT